MEEMRSLLTFQVTKVSQPSREERVTIPLERSSSSKKQAKYQGEMSKITSISSKRKSEQKEISRAPKKKERAMKKRERKQQTVTRSHYEAGQLSPRFFEPEKNQT